MNTPKDRLLDFEWRVKGEEQSILDLGPLGVLLPIHVFADDPEAIRSGLKPEECQSIDAYWRVMDDVIFLEVMTVSYSKLRPAGFYARWPKTGFGALNLVSVSSLPFITRNDARRAAEFFYSLGLYRGILSQMNLDDQLRQVQ